VVVVGAVGAARNGAGASALFLGDEHAASASTTKAAVATRSFRVPPINGSIDREAAHLD
jgi:hypothetical protein